MLATFIQHPWKLIVVSFQSILPGLLRTWCWTWYCTSTCWSWYRIQRTPSCWRFYATSNLMSYSSGQASSTGRRCLPAWVPFATVAPALARLPVVIVFVVVRGLAQVPVLVVALGPVRVLIMFVLGPAVEWCLKSPRVNGGRPASLQGMALAALLQQPSVSTHSASGDAATGIIGILEVPLKEANE